MKGKYCLYYDELETIFGNDIATGDNAQSGADNFGPTDGMQKTIILIFL